MKKYGALIILLLLNQIIFSQQSINTDNLSYSENVVTKNYNQSKAIDANSAREKDSMNAANIDSSQAGFGLQADIFRNVQTHTVNTIQNFSTLVDYKMTPGDMFQLSLQTSSSDLVSGKIISFDMQLQNDYTIELPLIGKISTKDKTISELREEVIYAVKSAASIQFANFVLARPAQFNVFINGGVNFPGYFPTTPLRTVIDAISMARGFKPGATYRKITLIRNNEKTFLDLSKYYEEADLSQNPYLQPGDKIHIPMADKITNITGYIKYKGTYELVESETLKDLILFAGGFQSSADLSEIEIHRTDFSGAKKIIKVSYYDADKTELQMGDQIFIRSLTENADKIVIDGAIYGRRQVNAGPSYSPYAPVRVDIPFFEGASLLSTLDKVGGPTPYARPEEAFIKRANSLDVIRVNIKELWETRDLALDRELAPGDTVVIPIENLLVFVGGEVNAPQAVKYSNSLKVFDYLMLAGGFNDTADRKKVYQILEDGKRVEISLDSYIKPGTALYINKNFAELSNEVFQDVLIYTNFVTSMLTTITTFVTLYQKLD